MSLISLDINVDDLAGVLQTYNRIEVWRSVSGEDGLYTEVTDVDGPTSAVVDGSVEGPFDLAGLTLDFTVDGTVHSVDFSGSEPLDIATVLNQINDIVPGLASEVPTDTDRVRLTSPTTGTGSYLFIASGLAATALGLSNSKVNGKAARFTLVDPTTKYTFFDLDGEGSYFYKTRFSHTDTGVVSEFSSPEKGSPDTVAPSEQLAKATARLLDGSGEPIVGRRLRFFLQRVHSVPTTSYVSLPGMDSTVVATTNALGVAEISLLKGATYRVVFEGTGYIREFTVPVDEDPFDLLALIGSSLDPFDIAQPPSRPIKVS